MSEIVQMRLWEQGLYLLLDLPWWYLLSPRNSRFILIVIYYLILFDKIIDHLPSQLTLFYFCGFGFVEADTNWFIILCELVIE